MPSGGYSQTDAKSEDQAYSNEQVAWTNPTDHSEDATWLPFIVKDAVSTAAQAAFSVVITNPSLASVQNLQVLTGRITAAGIGFPITISNGPLDLATIYARADGTWSYAVVLDATLPNQFTADVYNGDGYIISGSEAVLLQPIKSNFQPVYRFFDPRTNDHFYTLSATEAAGLINLQNSPYQYEGEKWSTGTSTTGTTDVYRFYNVASGDHFYTTNVFERDQLVAAHGDYHLEGVAFRAYLTPGGAGDLTLDRFYNTINGAHHFSASASESQFILNGGAGAGWKYEGTGFTIHTPV